MPTLLALLAGAVSAGFAFLVSRGRRRRRMEAWREAARYGGLTDVSEHADFFQAALEGRAGELRVHLEGYRHGKYERGTRIEIRLTPERPGFSVRREGVGTALGKRLASAQEVEIGDPVFDRECFLDVPAAVALAVFDRPTRRGLSGLLGGYATIRGSEREVRASLQDGVLRVELREAPFAAPGRHLPDLLPGLLDLAHRLVPPPDLAVRLAVNLAHEPEAGVRMQIVLALAREFRNHPATHAALLAACTDPGDQVRLRAATALGEDGRETLLALVAQDATADDCRAQAVAALGTALDPARLETALRQARAARRLLTACACLQALADSTGESRQELLVDALSDEATPVRLAAVRGLGQSGTVAAVAPLLALESAGGEIRGAARQAIAEIQARLKGAAPGQLTLAAAEAGTLSLADGASGQLSVSEVQPAEPPREAPEGDATPVPPPHPLRSTE